MFFFIYNFLLWVLTFTILPWWAIGLKIKSKPVLPYFLGFSHSEILQLEGKPVVWVQASSVGETMVAATFLREFKREYPECGVVFTCTTRTGKETAHRLLTDLADLIGFFPFDHPWVVKRFVHRLHPQVLILIETELWPNVLLQARKNRAKTYIVNGRVGDRSFLNLQKKGLLFLYRPVMKLVDFFCVQSETDKERFVSLGAFPKRVQVTGNIKFEQQGIEVNQQSLEKFITPLKINPGTPILTAGSTHGGEDEVVLAAFTKIKDIFPDALLILAPRHLERIGHIESLLSNSTYKWIKRSGIRDDETLPHKNAGARDILLLDTYGELGMAYSISTVVFVGGSLIPIGGHNVLEAALLRRVALYGPYMHNFRDSKELLEDVGAGFVVKNEDELSRQFIRLYQDKKLLAELGEKAYKAVMSNKGASKRTIEILKEFINGDL